jgi:hypothetical protein
MIAAFRINVFFDFNLNILFLCFFGGGEISPFVQKRARRFRRALGL